MILKIKHGDSWTFIDNVENVTKEMETEMQFSGFISYWKNGELLRQNVKEGCYLLNDKGQTIERFI
jgi:hypothetical protein